MNKGLLRWVLVLPLFCLLFVAISTAQSATAAAQPSTTGNKDQGQNTDQSKKDERKDAETASPDKKDDNSKPVATPTITDIEPAATLNIPNQTLVLTGKDFQDKLTVSFQDPQGRWSDLSPDQLTFVSATKVAAIVTLTASGKWKVHAANPRGAASADYTVPVAFYPAVDPNSPSVNSAWAAFYVITALLVGLLAVMVTSLVFYMRRKKWSLADALSEESSEQPQEITNVNGENNVIMVASVSRLIALLGLLGILTTVLGIGYAIIWNMFVYGTVPPLAQVRSFLYGAACLFAPYLANQVRSAFDSDANPKKATDTAQPTPAEGNITGVSPTELVGNEVAQQLRITGNGFQQNLKVTLTDPSGAPATIPDGQIISREPTLIVLTATLGPAGTWKVTVQNPGAKPSKTKAFTVGGKSVVQSSDPMAIHQNAAAQAVAFLGSGFRDGLTVALTNPARTVVNVAAANVTVNGPQRVTVNAVFNPLGAWSVKITNPGPNSTDFSFTVVA